MAAFRASKLGAAARLGSARACFATVAIDRGGVAPGQFFGALVKPRFVDLRRPCPLLLLAPLGPPPGVPREELCLSPEAGCISPPPFHIQTGTGRSPNSF